MLQVLLFCFSLFEVLRTGTCRVAPEVGEAVVKAHNSLRAQVATRGLDKKIFGVAPGSRSLFKLVYDRPHAALAAATIGNQCKQSPIRMNALDKAENFKIYRLDRAPNNKTLLQYFLYAVEDWRDTVHHPLRADVKYTDESMEPFANMIYHKTLRLGCAYRYCKTKSKIALACVYDKKPALDEPLYLANSNTKTGCRRDIPCRKIINQAVCETRGYEIGPLCELPRPQASHLYPIFESGQNGPGTNLYPAQPWGIGPANIPGAQFGNPSFASPYLPSGTGFMGNGAPGMQGQSQYGQPINLESCRVQQVAGLTAYILHCEDRISQKIAQAAQQQYRPATRIFICQTREDPGNQGGNTNVRNFNLVCSEQQQQYNPTQKQSMPIQCDVNQQRFFQAAQQQQGAPPTLICLPLQPLQGFMNQGMNPAAARPRYY